MSVFTDYSLESSHTFSTLVDLLRYRALHQPNRIAYTFLRGENVESDTLNYQQLNQQAQAIAAVLQNLNTQGCRAVLLYPPGLEFISAFFGCLYAGVVAVPAYPPQQKRSMSKLQAILADAEAEVVLTTQSLLVDINYWFAQTPELAVKHLLATDIISEFQPLWLEPHVNEDSLAFLQYTSGSTATPKGVMVSHRNLLHNLFVIRKCFEHTPESRGVIWLPLYHDMGLIGGVLQPLYCGFPVILMPPVDFVSNPFRWLKAISSYKATTSGGPNFAYDLCVRKIAPEQRASLDLSSWKVAFNGAEPIRASTLERFTTVYESCGFRASCFHPCYGLAEATLVVSSGSVNKEPTLLTVQTDALGQGSVVEATLAAQNTKQLVGCGHLWFDARVVIVDPDSCTLCLPNRVGEIWVSSSSVAQGYWSHHKETVQSFQAYLADTNEGPFLRTGDLGIIKNGELFVTGRLRDLIIVRGCNYYPQDIELTVEQSHPGLRLGCGAAFSVEVNGEERLVIAQEIERQYLRKLKANQVVSAIRQAVLSQFNVQVYTVLLLRTGNIPKTSSGKIQRRTCKNNMLAGRLDIVFEHTLEENVDSIWLQTENQKLQKILTRETFLSMELNKRQCLMESYLCEKVAEVLKISGLELNAQKSFEELGIDSFMAAELKDQIESDLKVNVPIRIFFQRNSVVLLTRQILDQLLSTDSIAENSILLIENNDWEEVEL